MSNKTVTTDWRNAVLSTATASVGWGGGNDSRMRRTAGVARKNVESSFKFCSINI